MSCENGAPVNPVVGGDLGNNADAAQEMDCGDLNYGGHNLGRKIKPIDRSVANKICSGQVITSLSSAVKELVENSLDSGASFIEVKLTDNGVEAIEVSDNGSGIREADFELLCQKYTTSKINKFDDLTSVSSFGFRGEALSSLCELASQVTVFTRTSNCTLGSQLDFDRQGKLVKKTLKPKNVGTSVTLKQLFSCYPVRWKHLQKQRKKQFSDAIHLLNAYALAIPN
ncbi:Mismatch repair endonuclease PMS2 [Halotydeus destructor]|nr:Mismatch repair endonuclease PMS2 [Halotydeus destructor]